MEERKNKPIAKKQVGRFQISIWRREKIIPGDKEMFRPERKVEIVRACVQYSRFNRLTREFDRQHIWCSPMELRDLVQVLDTMNKEEGGESHE